MILLTDMVVENRDLALQVRNRYARRWAGCETSVEFLKSQIGPERFAVRKYKSMQRLIFFAGLAMAFLSYLLVKADPLQRTTRIFGMISPRLTLVCRVLETFLEKNSSTKCSLRQIF